MADSTGFQVRLKLRHETSGRVLGCSSAINGQALIPTSKAGIDAWEKLGNSERAWEELAPYYRRFHTLTVPSEPARHHLGLDYINDTIRGTSGPLQVSFSNSAENALPDAWFKIFQTLGFGLHGDPFSGQVTEDYNSLGTIHPVTKDRSYSAVAYYQPASQRSNLHLVMGGNVHEIILEKTDAFGAVAVSGVKFTCEEKEVAVRARKEVIVAAGAFQSPKLLKLSGIGSADLLGSLGIDTIVDNPGVGESLQDHLMTGFSFEVRDGVKTIDDLARNDPAAMQAAMKAYMVNKSGPFANPGVNSIAFMPFVDVVDADDGAKSKLPLEESHAKASDSTMNSFIRSLNKSSNGGSAMLYTYSAQGNFEAGGEANPKDITKATMPGNFITMEVCLLQPMSKGAVHLASANPKQNPSDDPQYLSKELDVEIFARYLQYLQTLVRTQPSFLEPDGKRSSPNTDLTDLDAV